MLRKITCSNFRSFEKKIVFEFDEGLNVIIGENNAGKTNFLRLLEIIVNRLRNHTGIQGKSLAADDNGRITIELPPETPRLTEEEYFNKNVQEPIHLGITFDLHQNEFFIRDLKGVLHETELSKRDIMVKKEIEKLNDNSKDLTIYFRINAIKQRGEGQDYVMESLVKSEYSNNNEIKNRSESKAARLDRVLRISFDYDKFSSFLNNNFIVFPEFRTKPGPNTTNAKQSPSGLELNNVLFNLKNGARHEQEKFHAIEAAFKKLFNFEFAISLNSGNKLTFYINELNLEISHEGVGAGVIQMLNILTHIIGEKNKIFVIDEPELNLHPHKKRILLNELKKCAEHNQIIFTTHSSDFIDMEQLEKVTLMKLVKGRSIIKKFRKEIKENSYMQNVFTRLNKTEQKEFFFARRVILVEGPTEFGALPKFAEKLNYDFNINSVSIIPIENSYFVGMIKILNEFEIPMLAVFDSDVLMQINGSIKYGKEKIKVSSLFKQLDELNLLNDSDKQKLKSFESRILKRLSQKKKNDAALKFLEQLQDKQEIPQSIRTRSTIIVDQKKTQYYDDSIEQDLRTLLTCIIKNENTKIKILELDFEGIFRNTDSDLLKESNQQFGHSKILQGYFMANRLDEQNIPPEIKDMIENLRSFHTHG
jgi:predicted ATP-dependent endonuclease of OLD family